MWYLLEKHRFTSFHDLKLGLHRLESEVEKSDQAPVEFIRNNLDAFLQSYDTLSDILRTPMLSSLMEKVIRSYKNLIRIMFSYKIWPFLIRSESLVTSQ